MSPREVIHTEIEKLSDDDLDMLYPALKTLLASRKPGGGLISRLREIQIDGPEDFSSRLDDYLYGEHGSEPDPR